MKGIVLAGGTGSRLYPLTRVTNKHLLPVYDRPMIYYPIEYLVASGITDIMIVVGGNSAGDFLRLLGNGEQFGLKRLHYAYQAEPKGIADALNLARDFVNREPVCVILGDNIFQRPINDIVTTFDIRRDGGLIFAVQVEHPEHYGVIVEDHNKKLVRIEEKPEHPLSKWVASGLYIYDSMVWDFLDALKPSQRGELEITDVNNHYISKGKLTALEMEGWWADCGENFDSYLDACLKAREVKYATQRCPRLAEQSLSSLDACKAPEAQEDLPVGHRGIRMVSASGHTMILRDDCNS